MNSDELFMMEALKEAEIAYSNNEVPVGAVLVVDGKIISRAHNERMGKLRITSHAEINAIEEAEQIYNSVLLDNATLYTTLEPCPMCSYAIMEAHIKRVVYGAVDEKRGAISNLDIFNKNLGPKVEVCGNILNVECGSLLKSFFKERR